MPQNGQAAVLKSSPVWKKMTKKFKTLAEFKLKFMTKTWKSEAMAHNTSPKGCSLKIEILIWLLFFFI